MFGVTRLILEEDDASIKGEEDFFSVASTIPLVADEIYKQLNDVSKNSD
jgi:hypothetical protein